MMRRNDKRLAASRPGMTNDELVEALVRAGAGDDVARRVANWISGYYGHETKPHAMDRMKDDIAIDPGDMEDFVKRFFQMNEMPMPTTEEPETLPDYGEVTLISFALYLTRRRAELLGGEILA